MAMKKGGLGRGLDAILLDNDAVSESGATVVRISEIEPNTEQPRKNFNEEELSSLAESIAEYGLIQPITVRKVGERYKIIAGERRWRAARMAGLSEVPVNVISADDKKASEIALVENIQRKDLDPIEEAEAFSALIDEYGLTQEKLAERLSKNRVNIANSLRLLKLPAEVQDLLKTGKLSTGHAKVLLGLEDVSKLKLAANEVCIGNLSVRDTEKLVKALGKETPERKVLTRTVAYDEAGALLSEKLGTRVRIVRRAENAGKIEISFSSLEDFERISEHIR